MSKKKKAFMRPRPLLQFRVMFACSYPVMVWIISIFRLFNIPALPKVRPLSHSEPNYTGSGTRNQFPGSPKPGCETHSRPLRHSGPYRPFPPSKARLAMILRGIGLFCAKKIKPRPTTHRGILEERHFVFMLFLAWIQRSIIGVDIPSPVSSWILRSGVVRRRSVNRHRLSA